jgi:hypothetical protein
VRPRLGRVRARPCEGYAPAQATARDRAEVEVRTDVTTAGRRATFQPRRVSSCTTAPARTLDLEHAIVISRSDDILPSQQASASTDHQVFDEMSQL